MSHGFGSRRKETLSPWYVLVLVAACMLGGTRVGAANDDTSSGRDLSAHHVRQVEAHRFRSTRGYTEVHVSIPPPGYRPLTIVSTLEVPDHRLRIPVSAFDDHLLAHVYQGRIRILNDSLATRPKDLYFIQTPHLEPPDQPDEGEAAQTGCVARPSPSPDVRVEVVCGDGTIHGLLGTWEALSNVVTMATEPPARGPVRLFEDTAVHLFALKQLPDPLLVFAGGDDDPSRSTARTQAGYRFFWVDLGRVAHELSTDEGDRICADFLVPGGGYGGGFTSLNPPGTYVAAWLTVPRGSHVVHVLTPPGDAMSVRVSTEFAAVAYHDGQRRAIFVDNDTQRPVTGRLCMTRTGTSAIASTMPPRPPARRFFDPFPQTTTDHGTSAGPREDVPPVALASRTEVPVPSPAPLDNHAATSTADHRVPVPSPVPLEHPEATSTAARGAPPSATSTPEALETVVASASASPSGGAEAAPTGIEEGTAPLAKPPAVASERNLNVVARTQGNLPVTKPRPYGPGPDGPMTRPAGTPSRPDAPGDEPPADSPQVDVAYIRLSAGAGADSPADILDRLAELHQQVPHLGAGADVSRTFQVQGSEQVETIKLTVTRIDSKRYSILASQRDADGHWKILDVRPLFGSASRGHEAEEMERTTSRPVLDAWRIMYAKVPGHALPLPRYLRDDLTAQLVDDLRPLMAAIPRGIMQLGDRGKACTVLVVAGESGRVTPLTVRARYIGLRDYDYFDVRLEDGAGHTVATKETWRPKKDLLELINARAGTSLTRNDFR